MTTSSSDHKYKIVGIGGQGRSGKDTLAELFIKAGFFGVSVGDINRKYTKARHANDPDPISRENTTETSNWLRAKYGPDFLIKEAASVFEETPDKENYKGLVLFSIRAPIEVGYIKSKGGSLIYVESDINVRYQRAMSSLRDGEPRLSFEAFKAQEDQQVEYQPGIPKEVQMNHPYIKSHADLIFENNDNNLDEFVKKCQAIVEKFST